MRAASLSLLLSFVVLTTARTTRAQDVPDPCAGRRGVVDGVDGVDADGVLCDAVAAQAATDRFVKVTTAADAPHVIPPTVCDFDFMGVELDAGVAWEKDAKVASAAAVNDSGIIVTLRAEMAQERANPSGVVNLVFLHDTGEQIQYYTAERATFLARAAASHAHVLRLIAKEKREMAAPACVARRKAKGVR